MVETESSPPILLKRHSPPRVSLAWAQKNMMSFPAQISPSQLHPAQGKGSARVRHMQTGSGRQSPQRLRGSLSMGTAQCYPHSLLIDEASVVLSLLPQMPLNQHFQMRNPGPKDLLAYWLQSENQNAGPPTSKLSLISASCQPHRMLHSGQTQACHLVSMFPAQGPYWLGVCCYEDQTPDCLFGYLLSVSPWDLASTLPATGEFLLSSALAAHTS